MNPTWPWLSLPSLALLRRQARDVGQRRVDPIIELLMRSGVGEADVAAHGTLGRSERTSARLAYPIFVGLIELDADIWPEKTHEHVAVHECAEVAEHRLNLDVAIIRNKIAESFLVGFGRPRDLHGTDSFTLEYTSSRAECFTLMQVRLPDLEEGPRLKGLGAT